MSTLADILGPSEPFLCRIFEFLDNQGISVENFECDHICYRTSSKEEYLKILADITDKGIGTVIHQCMIGGRPIACVGLNEPISFRNHSIHYLEIPCPKPGRHYETGYEHVEFAITGSSSPLDNLPLLEKFMLQYPHVQWDTRAMEKTVNPDVSLDFGSGDSKATIKFHVLPLNLVCKYESDHQLVEDVPIDYFNT